MRYRPAYVFAAIGGVVVAFIAAAAIDPDGKLPLYVGATAPILLLIGILAYQWATASSEGRPREPARESPPASGDPGAVEDYWQMIELLALRPLSEEELSAARSGTASFIRASVGLAAAIAILPIAAAVMVITGSVPDFGSGGFLVFLPLLLAPLGLLWARYMLGRAGESSGAILEPLGLELVELPRVGIGYSSGSATGMGGRASGATVIEGTRHGRRVRVTLGQRFTTNLAVSVPDFEVSQQGGRLSAGEGARAAVADVIGALAPSDRWRGLRSVRGGEEGIAIERKSDARSGWLWDLWLAEHLADALGRSSGPDS